MVNVRRCVGILCFLGLASSVWSENQVTVLFLGDSITAGFGIDEQDAFPNLIQSRVDSLKWPVTVINAGLSGETSSGGLRRIDWLLKRKIDVLVLELGANDGLRGIDPGLTKQNLLEMAARAKKAYPSCDIVIAGMQIPTNLGQDFTEAFRSVFPAVADSTGSVLIPFLLEGVGGVPELNLPDGKHPTAEGHKIISDLVWKVLQPLLEERISRLDG